MAKIVNLQDGRRIRFPDEATDDQINAALKRDFPDLLTPRPTTEPAGAPQTPSAAFQAPEPPSVPPAPEIAPQAIQRPPLSLPPPPNYVSEKPPLHENNTLARIESALRTNPQTGQVEPATLKSTIGTGLESVFQLAALPGRAAYDAAADAISKISGNPEYGGNIRADIMGEERPSSKFIADAARTMAEAPKEGKPSTGLERLESYLKARALPTAAELGQVAPEFASMAVVNPSGLMGRLLAAGFSAKMVKDAKPLFDQYAEEYYKPEGERDEGKLNSLRAGIIETFAVAPLAAKHGITGEAKVQATRDLTQKLLEVAPPETQKITPQPFDISAKAETISKINEALLAGLNPKTRKAVTGSIAESIKGGELNALFQKSHPSLLRPGESEVRSQEVQGGVGLQKDGSPQQIAETLELEIRPGSEPIRGRLQVHDPVSGSGFMLRDTDTVETARKRLQEVRTLALTPALRKADGSKIVGVKGKTHDDIYKSMGEEGLMLQVMEQPEHGFDINGEFVTREEAGQLAGEKGRIDSQRLKVLQDGIEKARLASEDAKASIKKDAPNDGSTPEPATEEQKVVPVPEAKIPQAPEGTIRLYHGEGGGEGAGAGAAWYTSDPQRARSFGENVSYVDVPLEETAKHQQPIKTDYLLPNELIKQSKPYTDPIEQKVYDLEEEPVPTGTEAELTGVPKFNASAEVSMPEIISAPSRALESSPGETVSAPQVMSAFTDVLKAVGVDPGSILRLGRITSPKASGVYKLKDRIIRIRRANDIDTAAHEIAHAIDDAVWGIGHGFKPEVISEGARSELVKLGKDLYPDKIPYGGYASEGWAEFVRLWMTDPQGAVKAAPKMTEEFNSTFLANRPELGRLLKRAQQYGVKWGEQGALARAKRGIAEPQGAVSSTLETLTNAGRSFERHWIDVAAPIAKFVKTAEKIRGEKIPSGEDPFATLTARRMTADAVVDYMATKGMLDWAGNLTGAAPLQDAFALVKGKADEFLIYLWAKRAQAIWATDRNPGMSLADANYLAETLDSPKFRKAGQIVYDWNNGILDYAAQASPDFAVTVEKIRNADPGFYIPLFREFKQFQDAYSSGKGGGGEVFKRLKGSGRRIKNPVESILSQARNIVLKSQQRAVFDQMLRIYESTPGLGPLITEVPREKVMRSVPRAQVIQKLLESIPEESKAQLPPDLADLIDGEALSLFVPAVAPKAGEVPTLPIWKDGKLKWYELDSELYKSLTGMDTFKIQNASIQKAFDIFLGIPARTMRLGTTGLRASFSLVTNPLRDFRTLMVNSASSENSAQLFAYWLGAMKDTFIEAATPGQKRSGWSDIADRLGIEMATYLGQDTRPLRRAAKRIKRGGDWSPIDMGSHLDVLRNFLQFPEVAARLAEVKAVAKDLGYSPDQPLTPEIAQKLATAGKQVTTDFTAAGDYARAFNQAIPFFNAQIQGPRAHVRALRRSPQKFMLRTLAGTGLAMGLWYANKDKDWWKEMSSAEKYLYTYIESGDELIRIPRSFEIDGLFMASTEALLDAWYYDDPERVKEWFSQFAKSLTQIDTDQGIPIPPLPVLPKLVLEQAANRDFFFNRPIVPKGEQENLRPEEQYGQFNTKAAIQAGKILKVSPRRIDYTVRSIFGPVGGDVLSTIGTSGSSKKENQLSDFPVFGVLFQRGGQVARNPRSIESLYDAYESALKNKSSKQEQETEASKITRLMLGEAIKTQTFLNELAKAVPDRKSWQELNALRIQIARTALERAASGDVVNADLIISREARKEAEELKRDGSTPKEITGPIRDLLEGKTTAPVTLHGVGRQDGKLPVVNLNRDQIGVYQSAFDRLSKELDTQLKASSQFQALPDKEKAKFLRQARERARESSAKELLESVR